MAEFLLSPLIRSLDLLLLTLHSSNDDDETADLYRGIP